MHSDNEEECVDDKRKDEDVQCCLKLLKDKHRRSLHHVLKFIGLLATVVVSFYIVNRIQEYPSAQELVTAAPKKFTREDLENRELPTWYDKAKIGISITWGIFSVVGFGPDSEDFWPKSVSHDKCLDFINRTYGNKFTYPNLIHEFTAERFEPAYWARLFANSGAKYVLLTCKDKDGYTLFPSDRNFGWDAASSGPYQDIVQDLLMEVNRYDMKFGIAYSAYEWFNPLLTRNNISRKAYTYAKVLPDLVNLVKYYMPSLICITNSYTESYSFDFEGFLLWLYGHFKVKDLVALKNVVAGYRMAPGKYDFPQPWKRDETILEYKYKFEKVIKLDKYSLGFRHNLELCDVLTTKEVLLSVISNIAEGRNVVLNIGPTKGGIIPLIYQKRLLELGRWLRANGEAVYGTVPWKRGRDDLNGAAFYTCIITKGVNSDLIPKYLQRYGFNLNVMSALYVIFFKWPYNGRLRLRFVAHLFVNDTHQVEFLDQPSRFWNWTIYQNGMYKEIEIQLPKRTTVTCKHAWVLRITAKPTVDVGKNVDASAQESKNFTIDLPKKDQSSTQPRHKYNRENVTSPVLHSSNQTLPNDPPVSPPG